MTFRSRKLLDAIHKLPCMARFPHHCTEHLSVVPAHSDMQEHGRGIGHKTADWSVAAMCDTAHKMLDTFDREQKATEWRLAHKDTMDWLFVNEILKVA